jgi:tetratricopeptide (TPR) repeat protein
MFVETTIKYLYSFILRQWWMIQIINWVINSFSFKLTLVCIIAIALVVAPKMFVQIKGENSVMFANPTILVLYNLGNYSQAIQYYDKALAMDPHSSYALINKGVALDNLEKYTGALRYLDKALAIDPRNVRALNGKGVALYGLGNYTGAIEYYDKALVIDPRNVKAIYNKGWTLGVLGNYTGAIE